MRDEVKFFVAYVVRGVECRDAWVNRVMGGRPSAARLRAACETQSDVDEARLIRANGEVLATWRRGENLLDNPHGAR